MTETTADRTTAASSCCTTDGSCHSEKPAGAASSDGTTGPVSTVYQVSGMTCGHCKATLTKVLGALAGVTSVHVDLSAGQVTVVSAGEPDDSAVAAAVDDAGYEVTGRA